MDESNDLLASTELISIDRLGISREETDDPCDIETDFPVESEQVGDGKMPPVVTVPPSEQKIRDPLRLPGIRAGDIDKAIKGNFRTCDIDRDGQGRLS